MLPMPRTPLTRSDRARAVRLAVTELPGAILAAQDAETAYGPTDPRTLRAWELVETHGATVHRQGRLLAGKSKGG